MTLAQVRFSLIANPASRSSATRPIHRLKRERSVVPNKLLRLPQVSERIGLKKSTIYKLVSEGTFPPPIKIQDTRASLWPEGAVNDWITRQIGAQSQAGGMQE